jgi:uncharacterized membrane protein (UPF0127 family)
MSSKSIKWSAILLLSAAISACTAPGHGTAKSAVEAQCSAGKELGASPTGLKQVQLCISSAKKVHPYSAELAITSAEQATGLMFRKSLSDDAGMIFLFPEGQIASFWMKNTLIPLDMVFIRRDGSIESIAENTVPYSETPVSSKGEVTAVLELRGGLTRELGIKPGDKVRWQ